MEISDLMLKKEEVPILHERNFQLPIYPKLLNPEFKVNPKLASDVFPQATKEWYDDLKKYTETADLDEQTRKWYNEVFLKKKPEIKIRYGLQGFNHWEEYLVLDDNGFARSLSISRDTGGTIYFNKSFDEKSVFVPFEEHKGYVRLPKEKAKAFGVEEIEVNGRKGVKVYVYSQHNVDYFPGALFLRNWGILYMNEAIKSVER